MRLMIAVSVAAVLGVFLLYTSFAGGATESLQPGQLLSKGATGEPVQLAGIVVGPITGDPRGAGLEFTLRDLEGTATVPVVYKGSVPDQFRVGRSVFMNGQLQGGVFTASPDSLVAKCPSKYTPEKTPVKT